MTAAPLSPADVARFPVRPRAREVAPFHTFAISREAHALKAAGRSIIHMEFGQPSTGAPPAALAAAREVLDREPMGYWESAPLRERLARLYREEQGLDVDPQRIVPTAGASPALVAALTAGFPPGARIAMARPGYVAYRNTVAALHLEPVEIACGPAERFQLTAAALAALDPAPDAVIVASPGNPTGTVIRDTELAAIADVCRARGVRIISDEIYARLSYVGPVRSMLAHAPDALVIDSFSKYFSMAGWRLGWLVAPEDRVERVRACVGNLFLTPPSISQHAGLAALDARDELDGRLRTYRDNRELMLAALPELGLQRIAPPDGAFYIYADVGHLTRDSLRLCGDLLRETGVATAPGLDFDPVEGDRFVRFSFAVSTPEVIEALRRLRPWFAKKTSI